MFIHPRGSHTVAWFIHPSPAFWGVLMMKGSKWVSKWLKLYAMYVCVCVWMDAMHAYMDVWYVCIYIYIWTDECYVWVDVCYASLWMDGWMVKGHKWMRIGLKVMCSPSVPMCSFQCTLRWRVPKPHHLHFGMNVLIINTSHNTSFICRHCE